MSYAIVTGASKGIGRAISFELAKHGFNLLLVARSREVLQELSIEIQEKFHVNAAYLPCDLSEHEASHKVKKWVDENEFPISVLVNNAGYGIWGNFHEVSLSEHLEMLQLNMGSLIELTHLFIPLLLKQKKAYILNVGSTTAYQAIPTLGAYAASKSFIVSFTRALSHELKDTKISVSCLSPGTTTSSFIERSGLQHMEKSAQKVTMSPEAVAKIAVRKMLDGKREIIPGFINWLSVAVIRFLPKKFVERTAQRLYKRKY